MKFVEQKKIAVFNFDELLREAEASILISKADPTPLEITGSIISKFFTKLTIRKLDGIENLSVNELVIRYNELLTYVLALFPKADYPAVWEFIARESGKHADILASIVNR